jgi:hypothetical protein
MLVVGEEFAGKVGRSVGSVTVDRQLLADG